MALVLLDQSATRRRDRWRRRAVRQTTSDSSSECGQEEPKSLELHSEARPPRDRLVDAMDGLPPPRPRVGWYHLCMGQLAHNPLPLSLCCAVFGLGVCAACQGRRSHVAAPHHEGEVRLGRHALHARKVRLAVRRGVLCTHMVPVGQAGERRAVWYQLPHGVRCHDRGFHHVGHLGELLNIQESRPKQC